MVIEFSEFLIRITSSLQNLLCPPDVLEQSSLPDSAHLRTVLMLTLRSLATWPIDIYTLELIKIVYKNLPNLSNYWVDFLPKK